MPRIRKNGKPWTAHDRNQPHAVYRMYASNGELLYIGCSADAPARVRSHMGYGRPWVYQVARIELEWHPDLVTAREAEGPAIANEKPHHNIDGTPRGQGKFKGLPRKPGQH